MVELQAVHPNCVIRVQRGATHQLPLTHQGWVRAQIASILGAGITVPFARPTHGDVDGGPCDAREHDGRRHAHATRNVARVSTCRPSTARRARLTRWQDDVARIITLSRATRA